MYDGGGVAGTSVGGNLGMRVKRQAVMQDLIDHGRNLDSVLKCNRKGLQVLIWEV